MSIVKTQEENNDFLSPHFSLSMLTGLVVSFSEFLNTETGFLEALSNLQCCEFLPLLTIATSLCPNGLKVACKKICLFFYCDAVCANCAAKIRLTATKLKTKQFHWRARYRYAVALCIAFNEPMCPSYEDWYESGEEGLH